MVSVETCMKLQEEIITLIGDNLLEEDAPFLNLLSKSRDSKGVLELAAELKEAGTSLLKQGDIDNALEKYGYAVVILAHYHFEEECDRAEFLKLAISSLMNSVLCFSKKKEFVEVGKICSIVLDFDPYNVKAMYRRAMAALELGKRDWAKLDLRMALDIDPNNKEVLKKLDELKDSPIKEMLVNHSHGAVPAGLGIGLSTPKKKKSEGSEMDKSTVLGDSQVSNSCKNDVEHQLPVKDSSVSQEEGCEDIIMATNQELDDDSSSTSNIMQCEGCPEAIKADSVLEIHKEGMEGSKDYARHSESSSIITEEVDMARDSCNSEKTNIMNPTEPILRFNNRKRQGSTLAISRNGYLSMTKGKTLKFYNAKLGSIMEVRIVNKTDEHTVTEGVIQSQEKVWLQHDEYQSKCQNVMRMTQDIPDDAHSEVSSCITSDHDMHPRVEDGNEGCSSNTTFVFSANPKIATKKLYRAKMKHPDFPCPVMKNERQKKLHNKNVSPSPTNFCECRFVPNNKRKNIHPFPMDSYHRPRKIAKYVPHHVCTNYVNVMCAAYGSCKDSDSGYCTNARSLQQDTQGSYHGDPEASSGV